MAAARVLADAVSQLRAAGVPLEALARYVPERRVMLIRRQATMEPLGEVWRLGTLLLSPGNGSGPALYAAGNTTRAAKRLHPSNQSISREERRDIAAAALHGGYAEGTTVNFDASPIVLEASALRGLSNESPLGLLRKHSDGRADHRDDTSSADIASDDIRVRWRAGAPLEDAPSLREYLAERIDLLVHPPQGA